MERVGKADRIIAYLRTVSVRNLPHGVSKERLKGVFEYFGKVDGRQIHVFMWKEVGLDPLYSLFNTSEADCSICVSNISRTTTPQALKSYFDVFGGIKYKPKIKGIGEARRFAHITYIHALHRDLALQADGTNMDGSKLLVEPCYRRQRQTRQ